MEIRQDVPIPERTGVGAARKYPFGDMAIGDSLSFEDSEKFEKARRAATVFAKRNGVLFTSRKGYEHGEHTGRGGTIWRVE
jgi:hypothetical protein